MSLMYISMYTRILIKEGRMFYIELEINIDYTGQYNPRLEFETFEELQPFLDVYLEQGYTVTIGRVGESSEGK